MSESAVHKPQNGHRSWWSRLVRLGQDSAEAGFSGWLVICTAFLCILTALNVWVLHSTDRTLYEQAVGKDRGWIVVDLELAGAKFQEPKDPISLRLLHRNIGAAAVTQLTYDYRVGRVTRDNANARWDKIKWTTFLQTNHSSAESAQCARHTLPTMLPATPTTIKELGADEVQLLQGDVWWGFSDDAQMRAEKLKTTFFVQGCSHYWSIRNGRTEFCRYLDTNDSDPSGWQIRECPEGNKLE